MAELNPEGVFRSLKESTKNALQKQFPITGKKNELRLVSIDIPEGDAFHPERFKSQYDARVKGKTWGPPVNCTVELYSVESKKVLDRKKIKLLTLPATTHRLSYIVGGNERNVNGVFRLKAGAYHGVADNGEILGKWNLSKGKLGGFNVSLDQNTGLLFIHLGPNKSTKMNLYSLLRVLGMQDAQIEKVWGTKVFEANKAKSKPDDVYKVYRVFEKKKAGKGYQDPDKKVAIEYTRAKFQDTELFPEVSKATLGQEFKTVEPMALAVSGRRLLGISKGTEKEDDRQSLTVKTFHGIDDFVPETIERNFWKLKRTIGYRIDKATKVTDVLVPGALDKPVKQLFDASELADQTNPVEFLGSHTKTTILGREFGGIAGENINLKDDQMINPSHIGLLDPLQTPESKRTGITLHVPMGAKKKGNKLVTRVYDVKKHIYVEADASLLENSVVAYPDQYKPVKRGGKTILMPVASEVTVYDKDRSTAVRPAKDVDYVLTSAKALFGIGTNLVPFLQNDSGNRAMMSAKHQEQSISLQGREAPLVQTLGENAVPLNKAIGATYSHSSKIDGEVVKITDDEIHIKDKSGKIHKQEVYNHYPLNGAKVMINAEPTVEVGQKVKAGQTLADTNFTKGGDLAIGTNLRVAYIPFKGYNFEDGVVVSESAAKKMASNHLHEEEFTKYPGMLVHKELFMTYAGIDKASPERMRKIDDKGVIKVGQKVQEHDVLICGLTSGETQKELQALQKKTKMKAQAYIPRGVFWEHEYEGEVVKVVTHGKTVKVFVKTIQPMEIGDKIAGRHGNKGMIAKILPDHEMPKDKDGKHFEILLSPAGIPSRMNVGQVLETAASKIAEKTGKPYMVSNFEPGVDYMQKVKDDMKKAGVKPEEEIFDAKTGRSLGQVFTGKQYILKLKYQAEKKQSARSFGGGYTDNGAPRQGSGVPGGGQRIGQLDTYAMLAHGAKANLRESRTYKSDEDQSDVWMKIQLGMPLPPPKVPRSMHNFVGYLKGMGIDVQKKGDLYTLTPMTDKQTLAQSNGEIKLPAKALYAKGGITKEERYGLFDPKITGGIDGKFWGHVSLDRKLPNPAFERAIISLMEIKQDEYEELVGPKTIGGKSGFDIIEQKLKAINVDKELAKSLKETETASGADLNRAYKRVRYLKSLKELKIRPEDAYLNKQIPVIPPSMRRVSVGYDGRQVVDDLNFLYLRLGQMNDEVKASSKSGKASKAMMQKYQADMYDCVRALKMSGMDHGAGSNKRHYRGLMENLSGPTPKTSYFQDKVMAKRQDLSGRSVIIPEPNLKMDEVGIPHDMALEMYKPFIVKEMVRTGAARNVLDARVMLKEKHPSSTSALHAVVAHRPLIMKRDPSLHKFNVMGFKPKIISGKAIKVHPLIVSGFNADFDGDTMGMFVPVSEEAVQEVKDKMLPSKNLLSATHYGVMHTPGQDGVLGLYHATKWGPKKAKKNYSNAAEAVRDVENGKVKCSDIVKYKGRETTAGRIYIDSILPSEMRPHQEILFDKKYRMTKGKMKQVMKEVALKYPKKYNDMADGLKKIGYTMAYWSGSSIRMDDFHDGYKLRNEILKKYEAKEKQIRRSSMSRKQKDKAIIDLYQGARKELEQKGKAYYERREQNKMYDWARSGAKGNWNQFGQLVMGPMLVQDAKKRDVPVPLKTSYGEGMPISQYYASLHGARKGTIDRASATADPGALAKDIVNTVMNEHITVRDCMTPKGSFMQVTEGDVEGRILAAPVSLKGGDVVKKGEFIVPSVLKRIRNSGPSKILVRSPLYCAADSGICAMCYGLNERGQLYSVGTNIGVISGQAMSEPVTQMQMRTFHTGGASGTGGLADAFQGTKDLLMVPKKLKGEATIADRAGTITKIEKNTGTGGEIVYVGTRKHFIKADRPRLPEIKVGVQVKAGQALSQGRVNPNHLLKATKNVYAVRNHLTTELDTLYTGDVRRRNIEVVVKTMTNVGMVGDAAGQNDLVRGQLTSLSQVEARNKDLKAAGLEPVKVSPVLKPLNKVPLSGREDWMARLNYQRLEDTYLEGAAQGWSSDIHGHPISGLIHGAEFGMKEHPSVKKIPGGLDGNNR